MADLCDKEKNIGTLVSNFPYCFPECICYTCIILGGVPMNSRERMFNLLNGRETDCISAAMIRAAHRMRAAG